MSHPYQRGAAIQPTNSTLYSLLTRPRPATEVYVGPVKGYATERNRHPHGVSGHPYNRHHNPHGVSHPSASHRHPHEINHLSGSHRHPHEIIHLSESHRHPHGVSHPSASHRHLHRVSHPSGSHRHPHEVAYHAAIEARICLPPEPRFSVESEGTYFEPRHYSSMKSSTSVTFSNGHKHSHFTDVGPTGSHLQQTSFVAEKPSSSDQPLDLSMKKTLKPGSISSDHDLDLHVEPGACPLLRNILSEFRQPEVSTRHRESPNAAGLTTNATERLTQRVTLAKKNRLPVCSRISDWVVKIVQFAKSLPEFGSLPRNDQVDLVLNSWPKLLVLQMAENNFHFVVTPVNDARDEHALSPAVPTVGSVNRLQRFLHKCEQLKVDKQEYFYLAASVLNNTDMRHLEAQDRITAAGKVALDRLRQYIAMSHPSQAMRYSKLLLCLPDLYAIDCKMVETLFCNLITEKTDMELLLKDLLRNIYSPGKCEDANL